MNVSPTHDGLLAMGRHVERSRAAEFWVDRGLLRWMVHSRVARGLLRMVGPPIAWRWSPRLRDAATKNAARLLGPLAGNRAVHALARRIVRSHYDLIVEIARAEHADPGQLARRIGAFEGVEHFEAAEELGRGIIVVTAHLGSFEVGTAAIVGRVPKTHVVFKRDPWPTFERARRMCRARLGVIEAPIDDGLRTWINLRDALGRNEVVLMQGDLAMPGQRVHRVPMLGGHANLPTGPAKLAAITGAPILPIFAPRVGKHVDVHIDAPIFVPTMNDVASATEAFAFALERIGRRFPDQWVLTNPICVEDASSVGTTS